MFEISVTAQIVHWLTSNATQDSILERIDWSDGYDDSSTQTSANYSSLKTINAARLTYPPDMSDQFRNKRKEKELEGINILREREAEAEGTEEMSEDDLKYEQGCNLPYDPTAFFDVSEDENGDGEEDEWEEETSYVILDLGTEVSEELINSLNIPLSDDTSVSCRTQASSESGTLSYPPTYASGSDQGPPTSARNRQNCDFQFVGLETGKPILKLGNNYFQGELDETIGTGLVFTQIPDQNSKNRISLAYKCNTVKTIRFSRIEISPKRKNNSMESGKSKYNNGDTASNRNVSSMDVDMETDTGTAGGDAQKHD